MTSTPDETAVGEPVAWQVKDYADGWITYCDLIGDPKNAERRARKQAEAMGAELRPLYAAPQPQPAPVPPAAPADAGWQTMETAPKDGTSFLAFDGEMRFCRFNDRSHDYRTHFRGDPANGYWEWFDHAEGGSCEPSFWHLLPIPPAAEASTPPNRPHTGESDAPQPAAQPLTPDWHPIASAPRTGRQINAMWMPSRRTALVRWQDGAWWTADHPCGIAPDFWCGAGVEPRQAEDGNIAESDATGFYRRQTQSWLYAEHSRLVSLMFSTGARRKLSEANDLRLCCVRLALDLYEVDQQIAHLGARASRADEVSEKEIIAAGDAIFAMWRDRWKREDVLMILEAAARARRSPSPATTDTTGGQQP